MPKGSILDELHHIARRVERDFKHERRLLSFGEYLSLFSSDPARHSRDACRYLRDMFEHYGKTRRRVRLIANTPRPTPCYWLRENSMRTKQSDYVAERIHSGRSIMI